MKKEEMRKAAVLTAVFGVVSITLMLHRSATKHILITDAAEMPVSSVNSGKSFDLLIQKGEPEDGKMKLTIPLAKSVSSEDIKLEDRYSDHELLIYVDCREEGFYGDNAIVSDNDILESAVCHTENDAGRVCLDFKLDGFYANESALTDHSTIEVEFFKPKERYDKVVLIDPEINTTFGGILSAAGLSENEVTLDVAQRLRSIAEKDVENKVKFFFTHMTDTDISDESKELLIKESCADMAVKIATSDSEDKDNNGIETYYNGTYFIRDLSNVRFADIVERSCADNTGNTALGIYECDESEALIKNSGVPSAKISLGYLTGNKDAEKLATGSYRQKAAEGIYQAILDGYKEME